jgi:hypothetical protein
MRRFMIIDSRRGGVNGIKITIWGVSARSLGVQFNVLHFAFRTEDRGIYE